MEEKIEETKGTADRPSSIVARKQARWCHVTRRYSYNDSADESGMGEHPGSLTN